MNEFIIQSEIQHKISINISDKDAKLFLDYINYLYEENKHFNLTGHKTKEEIFENLIVDSLYIFKTGINFFDKKIMDIGSGAGIPGIPIKIAKKSVNVTLVESNQKKCGFLNRFIESNKLKNIEVICKRAESLAKQNDFLEKFDIVTAKAFAPLKKSLKYAEPFLKISGNFITYKGKKFTQELKEAEPIIKKLNFALKNVYEIKNTGKKIVVFEKKKENLAATSNVPTLRPGSRIL